MNTPTYLNPSPSPFAFVELEEDHDQQLQFFTTPTHDQASSSISNPISFNTTQDQRGNDHPKEVDKYELHGGSSDHQVVPSSPSLHHISNDDYDQFANCKLEGEEDHDENKREKGSTKWMSSKMRLMQKMISSRREKQAKIVQKFHDHHQNNGDRTYSPNCGNNIIRTCSDCNTTKTPLWRGGPQGPKSLCNACGIRQRKARRAMAATAMSLNGSILGSDTSPTKIKSQNKEKKPRSSYVAQCKKPFKLTGASQSEEKLSFDDFALSLSKNISAFQRAFPKDEEEAAILLMALSCGLIHN